MTERPILFSGPMILPIQADVKVVTRRLGDKNRFGKKGDRLWVKETWRATEREGDAVDGILYRADLAFVPIHNTQAAADRWVAAYSNGRHGSAWRPSIFMPRWASRITLAITVDPYRQRLHDITSQDVIPEGAVFGEDPAQWKDAPMALRGRFQSLWEAINGEASWNENPLVWVIPFRRLDLPMGGKVE